MPQKRSEFHDRVDPGDHTALLERTRAARTVEGHHWRPPCEAVALVDAYLARANTDSRLAQID